MNYEYFNAEESGQFSFFRIPKALFTEKEFETLSTDAKLLYGILLDRISLSKKNGWVDPCGRVYIIYTISELKEVLHVSHTTVVKLLKELDSDTGIGLIEKHYRGCNRPSIIYVKNFVKRIRGKPPGYYHSGVQETGIPGVKNLESRGSKNWNPGNKETGIPEVKNLESSNTDINKTERIDTEGSEGTRASQNRPDPYGRFGNVYLSGDEYRELCGMYPYDCRKLIEQLSGYMESTGREYQNHFATLIRWAQRDGIRASGDEDGYDKGEYL